MFDGQARSGRFPAWIAALFSAVLIGGCAISPGMTYTPQSRAAIAGAAAPGSAPAAGAGAHGTAGGGIPASDDLVEINADLIAKERAARPQGMPADVTQLFEKPSPYTLGPGDILSIVVWDHPELNLPDTTTGAAQDPSGSNSVVSGYTVDAGGEIQFAYVGPLKLAGLTEMQARDLLAQKLSLYLRAPQVTLRIVAYRSRRVYVDGEVRTPGLLVLDDMTMTLPEAINRAGGFTALGDRSRVAITRGAKTVMLDIPDMIAKGANPDDIVLHDGDLVRVYSQNDSKVYVLGEVGHPGSQLLDNGQMTLNQALGSAGGVDPNSGDASQIFVVRRRSDNRTAVFHLNASSPVAMATADGFELEPNDVVFVDASSLVRWSRVINLLLPSTEAAATSRAVGY
ncbi:polysaccharide biosynthesis/export family protein [Burkholderia sp. WAC0059]|uniref:polysaccharide biosynthesis/export family protein n=1 Tax=Burkholderia sp. WAC0059 TaxID=2066022 RepID=UPI00215590B0|nr:polysaccharide biosynthesis/export family protein [Burkholderia sp. WAC0059]